MESDEKLLLGPRLRFFSSFIREMGSYVAPLMLGKNPSYLRRSAMDLGTPDEGYIRCFPKKEAIFPATLQFVRKIAVDCSASCCSTSLSSAPGNSRPIRLQQCGAQLRSARRPANNFPSSFLSCHLKQRDLEVLLVNNSPHRACFSQLLKINSFVNSC